MIETIMRFLKELAEHLPEIEIPLIIKGTQRTTIRETYPKETKRLSLIETIGIKPTKIQNIPAKIELITGITPYASITTKAKNIDPKKLQKQIGKFSIAHDTHTTLFITRPKTHADNAHDQGYDGKGTKIAIIDTGTDPNHPDLNIIERHNIITDETPDDLNGHGTHVGGIAAGRGKIDIEMLGIAPEAEIISVKVLNRDGYGTNIGVAKGIELAVISGAHIINLSLGGAGDELSPEYQAAEEAWKLGHIVVAAAGNEGDYGWATIGSPGCAPSIITVGAQEKTTDSVAGYSSKGPVPERVVKPDLIAPGGDYVFICDEKRQVVSAKSTFSYWTCTYNEYYAMAIGTSMATPHVAGAAAIIVQTLRENGFEYTGREFSDTVKWVLLSGCRPIPGYSIWEQGAGALDIEKSVNIAKKIREPKKYEHPYEKPPVQHPPTCGEIFARKIPREAIPLLIELSKRYHLTSLGKIGKIALRLLQEKPTETAYRILNTETNTMKLEKELTIIEEIEKHTKKTMRTTTRKLRRLLKKQRK